MFDSVLSDNNELILGLFKLLALFSMADTVLQYSDLENESRVAFAYEIKGTMRTTKYT